jgi:hypothetical protein
MITEPQKHDGFPLCVSLSIEFNPHAVYYETAAKWVADREAIECPPNWVSPEDRQRAIDTNCIWVCQWYPSTPVGSYEVAASSFDVLMAMVNSV